MGVTSFSSANASPERRINDESPEKKRRGITGEYEEKVKKNSEGGIENSHGKTFRGCMLGRGGGGAVYLTVPNVTAPFDAKVPSLMTVKSAPMEYSSSIQLEKKVLSLLNGSPNLVRCYGDEITETKDGEKIYNMLVEYCSGGSLRDHIDRSRNGMAEAEVINYARDIARGLNYMHSNGSIHCDIKPANILLAPSSEKGKYVAKIADFGLTLMLSGGDENCRGIRGTTGYLAPEMVREREIDCPVDIWAFGCTVLEMLIGEEAWRAEIMNKSGEEFMDDIVCCYETLRIPNHVSEKAKDFLGKCLTADSVYDRWTAAMLLKHPFLSRNPTTAAATTTTTSCGDAVDINMPFISSEFWF